MYYRIKKKVVNAEKVFFSFKQNSILIDGENRDTQLGGAENEMDKDIEEIYKEEKGFYNLSSNGTKKKKKEMQKWVPHCMEDPSSVLR